MDQPPAMNQNAGQGRTRVAALTSARVMGVGKSRSKRDSEPGNLR